jgi:Lon-like protease
VGVPVGSAGGVGTLLPEVTVRRWLLLPLVVAVLFAGITLVRGHVPCDLVEAQPTCYVALRPGPAEDTLRLVDIEGAASYSSSGELLLTTVAVDDDLGFGEWFRASVSRSVEAVPRERIYPSDQDRDEVTEHNAALMADSQLTATMAALSAAGYEITGEGALVASVAEDAVTDSLLVGDVITAVDGEPVTDNRGVVEAVQARDPGARIVLAVEREGEELEVPVELGRSPEDPDRAYVGVLLTTELELPVEVAIDAGVIGGPSAGLMFALSIIELLGPEDLTGGAVVAGTGTLDVDGRVGAIGGIRQKIVGATARGPDRRPATVFFVPRGNVEEARGTPVGRDVLLVPVDTLDDALAALADLRDGREPVDALALSRR